MYRMLVNVVFKELPECIAKGEGISAKYKYVHHHAQI
jgi:hypothetical protein